MSKTVFEPLGLSPLVDSHAHLDHEQFAGDVDAVIQRAQAAGVRYIVTIGSDLASSEAAVRLAEAYPCVYATVGIHPHDATQFNEEAYRRLRELAAHPRVVAIGEIGLDYHYDFSPRPVQRAAFVRQLELARETGLPFVVHNREADTDTMAVLRDYAADLPGLMHSFAGSLEMLEECLAMGYLVSTGGMVTFRNADEIRAVMAQVPLDRLLVETDAPYLTPVPLRGRRNEPAYVQYVVAFLAQWRGVEASRLAAITTANACRFFRLPPVAE
ncbi:MAG TPA: TatD family hydrolase [Limnochordales bacterium]